MKHSAKGKTIIQYQKPLSRIESGEEVKEEEEEEMEIQKIVEDIEDLEFAIQNIMDQYYHNKEIQRDFKILEKHVSLLHNKYCDLMSNKVED